jgi:DNA-binding response OmpR family regulator
MNTAKHILLVEDDPNFGAVLRDYLQLNDYSVTLCTNGNLGLNAFRNGQFDICILDVMMPEKDGFTLAEEIRKLNKSIPLFFLTAKSMKNDMIYGFQLGADDYITKPFDSEVLLFKIKAVLNRVQQNEAGLETNNFSIGAYQFDASIRELTYGDEVKYTLSPKEAELLTLLAHNINKVLTRSEALTRIWKEDNYFTSRSMDVYVTKLRKYLSHDARIEILNIHGNGFRLSVNA